MHLLWMLARGAVSFALAHREERILTASERPLHQIRIATSAAYGLNEGVWKNPVWVAIQMISPIVTPVRGWANARPEHYGLETTITEAVRGREPVRYLVCAFSHDFSLHWGGPHSMRVAVPKRKEREAGVAPGLFAITPGGELEQELTWRGKVKRVGAFRMGDGADAHEEVSLWGRREQWHKNYLTGRRPVPHEVIEAKPMKW